MRYWKKRVPCAVFCQLIGYIGIIIDLLLPLLSAMFVDYILDYNPAEQVAAGAGIFLSS